MDDYLDILIANLKVLGAVPNGGRLAVRGQRLWTSVHGQFLIRFWHCDSGVDHSTREEHRGGATRDGRHHGTPGQPEWKTYGPWTVARDAERGVWSAKPTLHVRNGCTRLPPTRHLRAFEAHCEVIRRF
jgi:hypothetical protein